MTPRRLFIVFGLLTLAACWQVPTAWGQKFNHNSYLGKQPPELLSQKKHWLGWDRQVTLAKLKGKVVWLQFNF